MSGGRPEFIVPDLDRDTLDDYGQEPAAGCGRPDSPMWMAEWAFHGVVMDTGLFAGPLEMSELSRIIETDKRIRAIRTLVDRFASRLAARANPGAWAQHGNLGRLKPPDAQQRRQMNRDKDRRPCDICADGCTPRTTPSQDGKLRCGRCRGYLRRYGRERSNGQRFVPAAASDLHRMRRYA